MRLDTALWRAIAVYRLAALLYAVGSMIAFSDTYARPALGWAVLAGMTVWTAVTALAYLRPALRRWPMVVLDLVLTLGAGSVTELGPRVLDLLAGDAGA